MLNNIMGNINVLLEEMIDLGANAESTTLFINPLANYFGDFFNHINSNTDLSVEVDPEDMEDIFKSIAKKQNWILPSLHVQLEYLEEFPCKYLLDYIHYLSFLKSSQD